MRILFVSSGTSKHGISPIVLNQGESLKAKGIGISYFVLKRRGLIGYLYNIINLKRFLIRNKYEIIHSHYGLSGLVAFMVKPKSSKLIVSFMGTDLLGIQNQQGRVTMKGRFLAKLNLTLANNADYTIVKSMEMYNLVSVDNKEIIPNGVNLNKFFQIDKSLSAKKLKWDNNVSHILYLGDPRRPEKNFKLVKSALGGEFNKSIKVHILKDIPNDDLVYYYNASDICILTSFHEGSPNVIKEAMACNSVIVSTDVGDIKELFGDLQGCFITSFDPCETAQKIKEALNYSAYHGRSRERLVELGLDSENIAQKIIMVYKNVLGGIK